MIFIYVIVLSPTECPANGVLHGFHVTCAAESLAQIHQILFVGLTHGGVSNKVYCVHRLSQTHKTLNNHIDTLWEQDLLPHEHSSVCVHSRV